MNYFDEDKWYMVLLTLVISLIFSLVIFCFLYQDVITTGMYLKGLVD
jgi:hypothetical protein